MPSGEVNISGQIEVTSPLVNVGGAIGLQYDSTLSVDGGGNLTVTIPAGPTGPAGANGTNGTNGTNGATGATGADGAAGATGPSGVVSATAPIAYNSGTQTVSIAYDSTLSLSGSNLTVPALPGALGNISTLQSDVAAIPTLSATLPLVNTAGSISLNVGAGLANSSGNLTNTLVTGLSGGQTVIGDTVSGGNLTLLSNTAGDGTIFIGNNGAGFDKFGNLFFDGNVRGYGLGIHESGSSLYVYCPGIGFTVGSNALVVLGGPSIFSIDGTSGLVSIGSGNGTIDHGGNATFAGLLTAATATIGGTLAVTGNTSLGNATASGGVVVTGLLFGGSISTTGNVTMQTGKVITLGNTSIGTSSTTLILSAALVNVSQNFSTLNGNITASGGNLISINSVIAKGLELSAPAIVSANTTLSASNGIVTTAGNITLTLPAISTNVGRVFIVAKTDSSASTLTIKATSPNTINGSSAGGNATFTAQNSVLKVVNDGSSAWYAG